MEAFPSLMCRICEKQSHLVDLSTSDNQKYIEKFLDLANVTVITINK